MFGCERSANESLVANFEKNELKQEQFTFNYEGCEIYGKVLPVDALTRGFSSGVKVYDLVVESEFLKKAVITQLTQTFNSDGSFTLTHYVEGIKIATLFYNAEGVLSDIEIENNLKTRAATSFTGCVAEKYAQLRKDMEGSIMGIIVDCTGPVSTVALAATAAADCAGMFDNIGIK
ncbi:hypothetical protein M1B78_03345 [Bacteroides sp. KH569_7]|uniref:Uncharacterized protein n=1 Tax=Bacteroides muris (ex Fokt et al. 2023) TaxID=2937417 RepID=A0A9X2NVZ6_9BACE|nr:hypothetical protein [Bacteroides muris (ex Fokt et al. 2023)]MCR6507233.1 hypothetical protein [Bacteroides muris (ex Fokt et al. 2023)]